MLHIFHWASPPINCRRRIRERTAMRHKPRDYTPRLEVLENRRLLSITVNTLTDELDGSILDGDISLRDAIAAAHSGETINFSPALTSGGPATIQLTGQLLIDKNLTINGPGAPLLSLISTSRKFYVDDGNGVADKSVAISGLTLTGGNLSAHGAGIRNAEILTLTESAITGNTTSARREGVGRYMRIVAFDGGGIWNTGNLSVIASNVSDNRASKNGGGIWNSGNATITQSVILGNATTGGGTSQYATSGGGGIWNVGELAVTNSTISGNSTARDGGGIRNTYNLIVTSSTIDGNSASQGGGIWSSTDLTDYQTTILSSTISGNTAKSSGGGLQNSYGLTVIEFSTITANQAQPGYGSGIVSESGNNTRTQIRSSIIAGNVHSDADVDSTFGGPNPFRSDGYNLIGTGNTLGRFNQTGDQKNVTNPLLGPLADNGGTTSTHALLVGSPAIDKGQPTAAAGSDGVPTFDQRGGPFGRVYNGDAAGGARIDIGAFELQPRIGPALPGDYNASGTVDAADYIVWRKSMGSNVAAYSGADGSGNGVIDQVDYDVWKANFANSLSAPAADSGASAVKADGEQANLKQPSKELPTTKSLPAARDAAFATLGEWRPARAAASIARTALPTVVVDVAINDLMLLRLHRIDPARCEASAKNSDHSAEDAELEGVFYHSRQMRTVLLQYGRESIRMHCIRGLVRM